MDSLQSQIKSLSPRAALSRRGFVAGGVSAGFALAVQPVQAQSVITTDTNGLEAGDVTIPTTSGDIPGYRAMPASGKAPFPTLLVIHEAFGVHEHIKDVCRRLAKLGYFAVAPELFTRRGDVAKMKDIQEIMQKVISKTPDAEVAADLDAAAAWARASKKANTAHMAVTGFCWGGRQTWLYAAHNRHLRAAVAWYGPLGHANSPLTPKGPLDIVSELKVPVLGLYGGADAGIPVAQIEEMKAKLKAAHKPAEIVIYPDTPHGFNADYRPSYRPEAAKDGWRRMLAWFKRHGVAPA